MRAQLSIRDYEQLSAYLDGQLSVNEKRRLEARLNEQPELRTALDELGQTRALLRKAPRRRAPRNFTLSASMVGDSRPQRRPLLSLFPALSFASAIATLALVFTFLFELSPGTMSPMEGASPAADNATTESTALMQEQPVEPGAERSAAPAAEPGMLAAPEAEGGAAPPAITWGFPSYTEPYGTIFGKGGGPAGGMGGGAAIEPGMGIGGGAPDGNIVVPPEAVESLGAAEAATAQTLEDQFSGVPTVEGNGPILGVAEADRQGEYAIPPATPLPLGDVSRAVEPDFELDSAASPLSPLRVAQILLGALALVTGVAAFFIWRKAR